MHTARQRLYALIVAASSLAMCGCMTWIDRWLKRTPTANEIVERASKPAEAKGLAMLDWIVAGGFLLAAVAFGLSFVADSVPVIGKYGAKPVRAVAAGALATALCALVLKVLIVKYLWIIVPAILICAVIAGALYAYGHRKWIERKTGVDVTPWDGKGVGK